MWRCTLRFLANRLAFLSFLAAIVSPFAAMQDVGRDTVATLSPSLDNKGMYGSGDHSFKNARIAHPKPYDPVCLLGSSNQVTLANDTPFAR